MPDVCATSDGWLVVYREPGTLLQLVWLDRLGIEQRRQTIDVGTDADSTFPRLVTWLNRQMLAYRAIRNGDAWAVLRDVTDGILGPEQLPGGVHPSDHPHGNDPVCLSEDGWFAWQDADTLSVEGVRLDTGEARTLRPELRPTGLASCDGGIVVFVDDVRGAVTGMLNPVVAHACTVGEGLTGGIAVRFTDGRATVLLSGTETNTPRVADRGGDAYAAVTWGVGMRVQVVLFSGAELVAPPVEQTPVPTVAAWPRKLWSAPFFSHSERYGDTPLAEHVGNAICVVPDEREPQASLLRELDRIRPLGQPMIVAGGAGLSVPDVNVNTTIAWWVAAGRADDFPANVQAALARPEKPVIAYLDGDSWPVARPSWVGDRVWPSVQAYRHPGELLAAFSARVRGVLERVAAYGRPMVLTPRFDDFNGQGSIAATLECMPIYEAWIREFEIVGVMPFADRRGNGIAKNAALHAWAKAFLDATPSRPNRFDWWSPSQTDLAVVLRNKLQQTTPIVTLTDAEKTYLLARLT